MYLFLRNQLLYTVHFIANRTVGVCVIEKSMTVHFIANRTVGVHVMERSTIMTLNLLNRIVSNPVFGLKYIVNLT